MNPFSNPNLFDELDEVTRGEITTFIERKLNEHERLRGQVARDLNRLGEMAFLDPKAYATLKARYRARHVLGIKKQLAILEHMRQHYCKGGSQ